MDDMHDDFDEDSGAEPSVERYCPELTTFALARKEGLRTQNVLGCLMRNLWSDHWDAVEDWKCSGCEGERPRRSLLESVRTMLEARLAERKEDLVRVIDHETLGDVVSAKDEIKMLSVLCKSLNMAADHVELECGGWPT